MKCTHIHFVTAKVFDLFYIKKTYIAVFPVNITHQLLTQSYLPMIITQLSRINHILPQNNHTFSTHLQYLTCYLLFNYERFVDLRKIRN